MINKPYIYDTPKTLPFQVASAPYLELAKSPETNRDKLQKMVEEETRRNGYTEKVFHGTNAEKLFNILDQDMASMAAVFVLHMMMALSVLMERQ